ncbi:hypothetical protein ABZ890_44080 [Streptomyces sp. NPDC046984]|uniref:hypothetical protein n=1 Tax=Streptomyces sp. NPDC046984 TaxID=3155138 RepID=UPI0033C12F02
MDQTSQRATGSAAEASPKALPPPALFGFLLLLVVMFGASYAVGTSVGPVAPGMHGPRTTQDGTGGNSGGADMGGMDMDHGSGG